MAETVVSFPKRKIHRREKTQEDRAADIHVAFRRLERLIREARYSGLIVGFTYDAPPRVTKTL